MHRPSNINVALGLAAAALAVAVLLALAKPGHDQVWTDGESIHARREAAPIREILWRPATPLQGAGLGSADEYEPRYSADGTVVVFVRHRPGQNADLFTARWTPKGWGEPVPIDAINTQNNELGPVLSGDGEQLYFYSDRPGGLGGYDLWVSSRSGDTWATPTNLGPAINSRWNDYGAALSPDGDRLYFSSNRPRAGEAVPNDEAWTATIREHRTRRDYDLYVADLTAGSAEARPVAALNTASDEGAPAISPAGDFLYFASDRPGGVGGFDLYRARLTRTGFGPVENVGPSINSPANDLDPALTSDGFRLLFSSDRSTSATGNPVPGGPDPAVIATSDPARYSLWTSTSREVYRESQVGESRALALLGRIWPWLLLLALSLSLLYLFYRLLLDPRWRRRFGRLSLLAQCILISLLIHAAFASLLTIWKVGTGLIDMVHEGGGVRVVLTSGASSGSVGAQVRGSLTDAPASSPALEPLAATVMASLPELGPAALPAPEMAPPEVEVAVPRSPEAPGRETPMALLASPAPRGEVASSLPAAAAPMVAEVEPTPATPVVAESGSPALATPSLSRDSVRMSPPAMPAVVASRAPDVAPSSPQTREVARTEAPAQPAPSSSASGVSAPVPSAGAPQAPSAEARLAAPLAAAPAAPSPSMSDPASRVVQLAPPAARALGAQGHPLDVTPASPQDSEQVRIAIAPDRATSLPQATSPGIPGAAAPQLTPEVGPAVLGGPLPPTLPSTVVGGTSSRIDLPVGAMAMATQDSFGSEPARLQPPTPASAPPSEQARLAAVPKENATSTKTAMPGIPGLATPPAAPEMVAAAASVAPMPQSLPVTVTAAPSSRIDLPVDPAAKATGATQAHLDSALAGIESSTPERAPGTLPIMPAPSDRRAGSAGVESALPRVPVRPQSVTREAQLPNAGSGQAQASPASISAPLGTAGPSALVQIDPDQRKPVPGPIGGVTAGMIPDAPAPDGQAAPPASTAPRTLAAAPAAKGPDAQIPVGIPVPLETFAQRAPEARSELVEKMGGSNQTERAVGLALDWFARHQSKDGHWSAQDFDAGCGQCGGAAEVKADAAMTGMALLCYLGAGHTHQQDGPYREAVRNGLLWLVRRQAGDGDLRRGETMYGQTVAAVALCEAFSMTRDPALAEPARRAVEFVLVRAGQPASDKDTSVIGWLVFTVESARRAGLAVPQATFAAARQWLDSVAVPSVPGAYAYARNGPASAAMTAEGMFVQQLLGHTRDEPLMQQSARYVLGTPPKWREGAPTYYWYYATLALFQHQGEAWKQWNDGLVTELLAHQQQHGPSTGSWETTDEWSRLGGRIYQTAVCTLSLEVYYRYRAK